MPRRIAVIGAGQSGLALALGLLRAGYQVTLVSNRTAAQLRDGPVLSSQCMFQSALASEAALGLDGLRDRCPPVEGMAFTAAGPDGAREIEWEARLDGPAQSVDQRLKLSTWLEQLQRRGGRLVIQQASIRALEAHARAHELVVVATGRGALGRLFAVDRRRSPYRTSQRALALTYVRGMRPRPGFAAVSFNTVAGVGEYFVFPALTTSGECEIMVFEGIPGGPMDCWDQIRTPAEHLARSLEILQRFFPWERERCAQVQLTDALGVLRGRLVPTVRDPVARLPSGLPVLAMADAAVLNDPLTGQGANNAAKCAEIYLERIIARGSEPFDERWMRQTFEHYWAGYARWVVAWTNTMLAAPAAHVRRLLEAAQGLPSLAAAIANGFDDPRTLDPWWFDAQAAERLIAEHRARQRRGEDLRALRRALGQFATGVAVVTARGAAGEPVGLTVNLFTSLSLQPPLVLWCLSLTSSSLKAFRRATHFAVNVLAAGQHHLCRLFATPGVDRFAHAPLREGPAGAPLIEGALAHIVCRLVRTIDAGDHVIMVGEVEHHESFAGEPLVFHCGSYCVTTRHPELAESVS